jgi:Mn2+/Fe2+ NRAMP family transporter
VKVVVVVLTLSTVAATALVLPKIPWGEMPFLPTREVVSTLGHALWLGALIGWMPSAFDISIWHSLWTLARRRETKHSPTVRESLIDFKVGYLGTAFLSICFLTLGAGVIYATRSEFSTAPTKFAYQIIDLYAQNLGAWSGPLIGLSAFTVMFSTTLTVIDGFPRAIACLLARFREPEVPDRPSSMRRPAYWWALLVLGLGSVAVIWIGTGTQGRSFRPLVDLATTLSFLTAPALAMLNHRAMLGAEVPVEHRPGRRMIAYSWAGIVFSAIFAAGWLVLLLVSWFGEGNG